MLQPLSSALEQSRSGLPARTSLIRVTPRPTLDDTGLLRQRELLEELDPPVLDARDVLEDPPGVLRKLCAAVGVPFDEAMLAWEPGPRSTDGVRAKHWYERLLKAYESGSYLGEIDNRFISFQRQRLKYTIRALETEIQKRTSGTPLNN